MASTINATPTDRNANSYVTLAEANTYFDDRLATGDWTDASTEQKTIALFEATRRIDRFRFFEQKYRQTPEQSLEFPRSDAEVQAGSVDEAPSATSIVDETFINAQLYPDDYFNGWALEMRSGDHAYEVCLVTDFVASTGTFTIVGFGEALTVSDSFVLIQSVPKLIKFAVYETAIWLLAGGEEEQDIDPLVKSHSIGKFSETFADGAGVEIRLPRKAYAYLQKYISRIGQISV